MTITLDFFSEFNYKNEKPIISRKKATSIWNFYIFLFLEYILSIFA